MAASAGARLALAVAVLVVLVGVGARAGTGARDGIVFPPVGAIPSAVLSVAQGQQGARGQGAKAVDQRSMARATGALRGVAGRLSAGGLLPPRAAAAPAAADGAANLLLSPLSVAAALGQLLLGARGETRSLLADLLDAPGPAGAVAAVELGGAPLLPDLDYHLQFRALLRLLTEGEAPPAAAALDAAPGPVELYHSSALFAQRGLPLRADFAHALRDLYRADVRRLDFRAGPARAAAAVNAWARAATRGRISTALAQPLPPSTAALAASAVYFRGAWQWPFDAALTARAPFRAGGPSARRASALFMRGLFPDMRFSRRALPPTRSGDAPGPGGAFQLVVLPYKGGQTAMYVALPEDASADARALAALVTPDAVLEAAREAVPQPVTLVLPRMRVAGSLSLKEPLRNLRRQWRSRARTPAPAPAPAATATAPAAPDPAAAQAARVLRRPARDAPPAVNHRRRDGAPRDSRIINLPLRIPRGAPSARIRPGDFNEGVTDELNRVPRHASGVRTRASDERISVPKITQPSVEESPEQDHFSVTAHTQFAEGESEEHNSTRGIVIDELPPISSATVSPNRPVIVGVPLRILDAVDSRGSQKDHSQYYYHASEPSSANVNVSADSHAAFTYRSFPIQIGSHDKPSKAAYGLKDSSSNPLPKLILGAQVNFPFVPTDLNPLEERKISNITSLVNLLKIRQDLVSGERGNCTATAEMSVSDGKGHSPSGVETKLTKINFRPQAEAFTRVTRGGQERQVSSNHILTTKEAVKNVTRHRTEPGSGSLPPAAVQSEQPEPGAPRTDAAGASPADAEQRLNVLAAGTQSSQAAVAVPGGGAAPDEEDFFLDLTGASNSTLRVADALHHVWLEVTETGTEAAAVTATAVDYSGDARVMLVNRPFAVAIVHEPTGALLFWALVSDPTAGAGPEPDLGPSKDPGPSTDPGLDASATPQTRRLSG